MSNSKPVLGYWNIRGFAQPIRFLLEYLGVDYTEKLYTASPEKYHEWFDEKFSFGFDFPNIPYWIDGDFKITESKAILKYLARKYDPKLVPNNEMNWVNYEMLEGVLSDMWILLEQYAYFNTDQMKKDFPKNSTAKLEQISKFLGGNKFALGNEISCVDFMLYEVLYHYCACDAKLVNPFQNLMSYMKTFESVPQISKYINTSPSYMKSPCFSSDAIIKF